MRKNVLWVLGAALLVSIAGCHPGSENGANGENGGRGVNPDQKKSLDVSFIPEDCFFALVIHPKRITDSPLSRGTLGRNSRMGPQLDSDRVGIRPSGDRRTDYACRATRAC